MVNYLGFWGLTFHSHTRAVKGQTPAISPGLLASQRGAGRPFLINSGQFSSAKIASSLSPLPWLTAASILYVPCWV